jgi:pimeloyl-ACP methyl ester carboxylesterase
MNVRRRIGLLLLLSITVLPACGGVPTTQPVTGGDDQPFLLHLPGIGGHRWPDEMLTQGLLAGGIDAEIHIYDWTGEDEGLNALTNSARHERQAKIVADLLVSVARAQPRRPIIVTCHSGGAGIAAWAIEQLPEDVRIRQWLMVAPALSPQFDLSPALSRVSGAAYAFLSSIDPINGWGTRNFGTIDRLNVDAAGRVGFEIPTDGNRATVYRKLRQIPYDSAWVRAGNAGDHVGGMMKPFARRVIAPLLLTGELPKIEPAPRATTRPAA